MPLVSPAPTSTGAPADAGRNTGARALLDRALAFGKQKPLIPLAIGGALVIAIIVALLLWAGGPDYRVLYSNLSDADGGHIIATLEQQGIPYKFAQGGHALMVPADKVYKLRLTLAEQGLPQAGNVGFKIMDNEPFGISQFAEQVNYQRGLQGELANSIEALRPVASARVNLAMPKDSLFLSERQPAKATVVLTLRSGRALGEGQVEAIVHMVSSAVRGLTPDNVTVVDQEGRLLTRKGAGSGLDGSQLDYLHQVERSYQQRILAILKPVVGADNVHAQVTAQLDFNHREETDEHFGPNQGKNPAAVRSEQVNYATDDGKGAAGGIPGALTNTPPGAAPSPINNPAPATSAANAPANGNAAGPATGIAGSKTTSGNVSRASTINYEVDHNITHIQHHLGALQRLSVAVVVNYRGQKQKDGSMKPVALSATEMKQINDLTREAMGFSSQRGDTLAVVNSAFTAASAPAGESLWQRLDWVSLLGTVGRYALILIVLALLYRMILKPLRQHYLNQTAAARAAAADNPPPEPRTAAAEPMPPPRPKRKTPSYEHSLEDLKDMAKKDPAMIAMIVRSWIKRDEH